MAELCSFGKLKLLRSSYLEKQVVFFRKSFLSSYMKLRIVKIACVLLGRKLFVELLGISGIVSVNCCVKVLVKLFGTYS